MSFGIYVFAEARGIPMLKNTIVDDVLLGIFDQNVIPHRDVKFIYSNTPENDEMRALMVDVFTRWSSVNVKVFFDEDSRSIYPEAFLFDVCKASVGASNASKPGRDYKCWKKLNKCEYHDHTDINAPRMPKALTPTSADNDSTIKTE